MNAGLRLAVVVPANSCSIAPATATALAAATARFCFAGVRFGVTEVVTVTTGVVQTRSVVVDMWVEYVLVSVLSRI